MCRTYMRAARKAYGTTVPHVYRETPGPYTARTVVLLQRVINNPQI
jgi:hypothetical protein